MVTRKEAQQEATEVFEEYLGAKLCVPPEHPYYGKTMMEIMVLQRGSFKVSEDLDFAVEKLEMMQHEENIEWLLDCVGDFGGDEKAMKRACGTYNQLRKRANIVDLAKVLPALAYRAMCDNPAEREWFSGVNDSIVKADMELIRLMKKHKLKFVEEENR